MASPKQLWVIAGGNGAGKTTFCNLYLAKYGVKFVNADSIAMTIDPEHPENASYHAATLAAKIREDLISQLADHQRYGPQIPGKGERLQRHPGLYPSFGCKLE